MIKHLIFSLLIYLFVVLPCEIVAVPVLMVLLLTSWDGRSTIFGNAKHGRGVDRGYVGYWQALQWLGWRNPVNNLVSFTLAIPRTGYGTSGDLGIGDKTHGGFYKINMLGHWEYYWIKPYGSRCIRFRFGWKINGKAPGELCEYVLTLNPFKPYLPSA